MMIIPAAGLGARLTSSTRSASSGSTVSAVEPSTPKSLLEVNGKAMVDWLLDLYEPVTDRFILVLHPSFEGVVREHCRDRSVVGYDRQDSPTGMLDAVLAPFEQVRGLHPDRIWITWCDQIATHPQTMWRLARLSEERPASSLIFPTARRQEPYIHIVRDTEGRITAIRQRREGDAMPSVGESDMGLFALSADAYFTDLPKFAAETERAVKTGEKNFLPFIPWLSERGATVLTFPCQDEREAIGINTADDLRTIERYLRERGGAVTSR